MENESLVLLVCILSVCIEFLRGNRAAATEHSQHGISIPKRVEETFPWAKKHLFPIFRRLGVLPFFFRAVDRAQQPNLFYLDDTILPFLLLAMRSSASMGYLVALFLIRRCDVYRLGYMIQ
ncbi:hypothetical protein F4824DRAFT_344984 [Ustulina deusta]|nr:hypothetical protein F4824DRAFT_344984 [Ustulina deusta]